MEALTSRPVVSIVLPVRDEADTIRRTLNACLAQEYDGIVEVIVADGGSTDGTQDVLSTYRERGVTVVDNPAQTTPHGLNVAIEASTGEVIVRCDGHAVLPPDYVARAVAALQSTGAVNVGGIQRAVGYSPLQRGIARAMSNPFGVGDARFHRGGRPGSVDTVYLGAFNRDALIAAGGFDGSLDRNQDYELNIRLRTAGGTVWFDPDLVVDYVPRASLGGLWRQYFDYGRWKQRVLRMHPSSLRWRQAGPPMLVVGLAGSFLLLATPLRWIGAAALGTYGVFLTGAGVYEAITTKDPAGLLAGPAIGVMHVAWGSGFLAGRT